MLSHSPPDAHAGWEDQVSSPSPPVADRVCPSQSTSVRSVCCHLNIPLPGTAHPVLLQLFGCAGREGSRDEEPKGDKHQLASPDDSKGMCSHCTSLFALSGEAPGGAVLLDPTVVQLWGDGGWG